MTLQSNVKKRWVIFSNFVAFSQYLNLTICDGKLATCCLGLHLWYLLPSFLFKLQTLDFGCRTKEGEGGSEWAQWIGIFSERDSYFHGSTFSWVFFFIVNFLRWLFLMAKFPKLNSKLNLIYMTFSDQTMFEILNWTIL